MRYKVRQVFCLWVMLWSIVTSVCADELRLLDEGLARAKTTEARFEALAALSDYWSYRDTAVAFDYLWQASQLAKGDRWLEALSLFYKAGIYFEHDDILSRKLYMEAEGVLKGYDTKSAYRYRARLWHNYGVLEQRIGNDKAFLDITLTRCLPLAEQSGDKDLQTGYLTDVGIVFYNNKQYGRAMEYYRRAAAMGEQYKTANRLWVYLNMFDMHLYRNEMDEAKQTLDRSAQLIEPGDKLAAIFYKNKAKYYARQGAYKLALESIEDGIGVAKRYNFYWDYVALKYEKAQIYKQSGQIDDARKVLHELLQDSSMTGKNRLTLTIELAATEARAGNYSAAYELLLQHRMLNDSVNSQTYHQQLADIETRYRTAEKEREIAVLEEKYRLTQMLFFGGSLVVLMAVGWVWYASAVRRNRNAKDMLLMQQQREIAIAEALIDGEEQERRRLARELHDGLVGQVTAIKMKTERLAGGNDDDELRQIVAQLDNVITELRQTAHNLTPTSLLQAGLDEAIRDFCGWLQGCIQIRLYLHGLEQIRQKRHQISIYRIVQESLTNALRHSGGTELLLQCTYDSELLQIEVEDNGRGFDLQQTPYNMGLNNIHSRVQYLGGRIEINAHPGRGTTVYIECKL